MGDEPVIVLLDTHVWIWAFEGSERLGTSARAILENPETERWVTPVSTLEIARLIEGKDLAINCTLAEWIEHSTADLLLKSQEVSHQIAMTAYQLPGVFHRDPADRQIVATAICHGMTLITADERILQYPEVSTVDARI
jgi:PIN domain nuclease of toxin-antitoxin system